ncbi:hypothetical protein [Streptomyces sp. CAU 1734]|uniref:hypothetical protein n=1 Tax=Streptomyces sp. CAU 1734 TaxID=3140360 RepID=UPI0032617708
MAALVPVLVATASGCGSGDEFPAPEEHRIVGSWSNPGGDAITFEEGGTGLLSPGAQLQLSTLWEKSETKEICPFSWGVDTMPLGNGKWISINFDKGQCGLANGGRFGLHYYYGESDDIVLSPAVEHPEPYRIYSRSSTTQ